MRCPDCNKFTGLEFQDPELDGDLEVSEDGVTCNIRLVRTCSECGQEMKEATLEMSGDLPEQAVDHLKEHEEDETPHELEIEENGIDQIEEGGGRYKKSYFGASVDYKITCSCGQFEVTGTVSDKIPASHMEELV